MILSPLIHAIRDLTKAITQAHSDTTNHLLRQVIERLDKMAKTQAELAADIRTATEQLQKIGTETSATLQKVTDLQAIIDAGGGVGGTVSQELIDAVAALQAQAQTVDDLVPDAPTQPPV